MLYTGEDIKRLIPQRDPIMMVDSVVSAEGDVATTELAVRASCYFVRTAEGGLVDEPGLIEHIAQSASAFAGHRALVAGQPLPVGYIGEVKKFHCYERPRVGDVLTTTVTMGAEVNGITLLTGETRVGDTLVADTQMKIFVEDGDAASLDAPVAGTYESKDFCRIVAVDHTDELTATFHVELVQDCRVYRGHFPGKPVSPGVENITMIRDCASQLAGRALHADFIKQCRLTAVVTPLACPTLDVAIALTPTDAGYAVQATIADAARTYMEYKGTYVA